jgi:dTDP-4-dehydrorhamnose 3,5-epimerase
MRVEPTALPDVLLLTPKVWRDERGFFFESYHAGRMKECGVDVNFVQDNHSYSKRGVLRGIHYQVEHAQGKLVRVVTGRVFDVAVDLRRSSATFGKWVAVTLSADEQQLMWIPPGFGHAFLVLSESAHFLYKTTDFYSPQDERTIVWNDPDLNVSWPTEIMAPAVSQKDGQGARLRDAEVFE